MDLPIGIDRLSRERVRGVIVSSVRHIRRVVHLRRVYAFLVIKRRVAQKDNHASVLVEACNGRYADCRKQK